MKFKNSVLNSAGVDKRDEFYTQLADIEKELRFYKDQFAGKVVFCNCDDPQRKQLRQVFQPEF